MGWRRTLYKLLPEGAKGVAEYYFGGAFYRHKNGPLNGQNVRKSIVQSIFREFDIGHVVETGTFRGETTAYFAGLGAHVLTIEISRKLHYFSRARFLGNRSVRLVLGNSAAELGDAIEKNGDPQRTLFAYLDAHWYEHLPLAEELEIVLSRLSNVIVMIDDFEVPGDGGYRFDDYGPGKRICLEYLASVRRDHRFSVFFPAAPSSQETGRQRGCCVLTPDDALAARLAGLPGLRPWPPREAVAKAD